MFGKLILGKKGVLPKYGRHILESHKRTFTTGRVVLSDVKTMGDISELLKKILHTEDSFSSKPQSKEHLLKYMVKDQSALPVRKMKDSYDSAIIPLSTDLHLREKYTTFLGQVRLGRLMEDVDLFAGYIAHNYVLNPDLPKDSTPAYVFVTLSLSHIEFKSIFKPTADIRVSGHVCWVGKSSLEVVIWLEEDVGGKWERKVRALLLMAARNPTNTGPAIVNKIMAETAEEKELFEGGEQRKFQRLDMMKESLLKKVPSEEELHMVHNLFKNTIDSEDIFLDKRVLPENSRWMQDATLNNLVFCHPENRNLHNKIFGGFLIRQALELSWSVAYLYGMRVPRLVHISDIGFYSPVEVGSLLKLFSSVTYAEKNFIQVFVYAEAYTMAHETGKSTTSFYFTYDMGRPCDSLYPWSYLEAMKYIDGRRHFNKFMKYHEENKS